MSFEDIQNGSVIRYPFLWSREAEAGEIEGRKKRPTVVALRTNDEESQVEVLYLFPITSQPPAGNVVAMEIPETEKKRAGLEADKRLWVLLSDYNRDVINESYYLEPKRPIGTFSRAFFLRFAAMLRENIKRAKGVDRR